MTPAMDCHGCDICDRCNREIDFGEALAVRAVKVREILEDAEHGLSDERIAVSAALDVLMDRSSSTRARIPHTDVPVTKDQTK